MGSTLREDLELRREQAVLASVTTDPDDADPLSELRSLAETAGVSVAGSILQRRQRPDPRTWFGKGKIEELAALVKELAAGVVIIDQDLSPQQLRNIETAVKCKVIDRSELILDIFANRATTREARLQVEIAQLEYTAPRLRAMWSHLGQVTGGAPMGVGTRGPGEQQLEIDRRLVQKRLQHLRRQLEEIQARSTRAVEARREEHAVIGVVGYTNAGKSTLFNALTTGGAYADDRLFATLGTRVEQWNLGGGNLAMLTDTVGFIRDLPHHLVASFRSTLEQAATAHLLLVVLDVSDPAAERQFEAVREVLEEIGAGEIPSILVLNKIDRLEERLGAREAAATLAEWQTRAAEVVAISARRGLGLEDLRDRARTALLGPLREVEIELPLADSRSLDLLEKRAEVLERTYPDAERIVIRAKIARRHAEALAMAKGVRVDGRPIHEAIPVLWPAPSGPAVRRPRPHEIFVGRRGSDRGRGENREAAEPTPGKPPPIEGEWPRSGQDA
ncbi:MAG: GTPase HflX [Phycisphaerales bacterium]